jgi:hypothetical protein
MSEMYDDEEMLGDYACDDDDEANVGGPGFTVSMKGAPNMATVQWTATADAAIRKTAREWGCKPDALNAETKHG